MHTPSAPHTHRTPRELDDDPWNPIKGPQYPRPWARQASGPLAPWVVPVLLLLAVLLGVIA